MAREMKIAALIITALFLTAAPMGGIIFGINSTFTDSGEDEDSIPPTSSIESPTFFIKPPTYADFGTTGFEITWKGSDNANGAGIDHFDVQYRSSPVQCYGENIIGRSTVPGFSSWRDLVTNTTETSNFVAVSYERTVEFRVRAVDKEGNEESWSPVAEAGTVIVTVPTVVYNCLRRLPDVRGTVQERISDRVPENTPPGSRVLPLAPLAIPEPVVTATDEGMKIIIHPDIDLTDPNLVPGDDILWWWNYAPIEIRWEGCDLKGSGELRYDVQYRRVYLEEDPVHIPEAPLKPPIIPGASGWKDWISDTTSTYEYFEIVEPGLYEFRCRATDPLGNVEEYPAKSDAFTYVLPMI